MTKKRKELFQTICLILGIIIVFAIIFSGVVSLLNNEHEEHYMSMHHHILKNYGLNISPKKLEKIDDRECDTCYTFPLVAYSDKVDNKMHGSFILGCGSIDSDNELIYRFMVSFPIGIRNLSVNSNHVIIKFVDKDYRISIGCRAFLFGFDNRNSDIIIYIPINSIAYDNILNGK